MLFTFLFAGLCVSALASSSIVSNVQPRVDASTNATLDIHDGTTIKIGNVFYWYGASYGMCHEQPTGCSSLELGACGFQANHTVSLATSTDLIHWTLQGVVLAVADRPEGIIFSPWVAQSASTGLYVLWFNVLPIVNGAGDFDAAYYAIATSETPSGPFKTVVANVSGIAYDKLPDAPSIFVDDDGEGYIAFTHEDTHVNNVQQLTPDLLGPLVPYGNVSTQIGPSNFEGIFMFKREGSYYVGAGPCCCFCSEGSDVYVYKAASPLGPYTAAGTLTTASVWGAQTGTVWYTGVDYVLFGDRWQSAYDSIKGHDFSYMSPIEWNSDGTVLPIAQSFQDNVTISY